MKVEEHEEIEVMRGLVKRERDGRVRARLQGVVLARQGRTAREIGQSLSVSERSARAWVRRYNSGGVGALAEQAGRGRRARLSHAAQERFCARLDAGAQAQDEVCSLRGADLVRVLGSEFGVSYSRSGVYRLLHRLGYSSLQPRPQHRKTDVASQEAFKKMQPRKSDTGSSL